MDHTMRAIIFDLDDTIYDTVSFRPYLRTAYGREVIPGLISSGNLNIKEKFPGIIEYINNLIQTGSHIYILSDSPKEYCASVITKSGLKINLDNVYGSQHKPCVEHLDFFDYYDEVLVVGDSPKDIYFAHLNSFSSVMLANLSDEFVKYYQKWTKPGEICRTLSELNNIVDDFYSGNFIYKKNDFCEMYKVLDSKSVNVINIDLEKIGYAHEYWPNPDDWGEVDSRKSVWFDVKRSIKVAKELNADEIKTGSQIQFFNRNNQIGTGRSFKSIMWTYFDEFRKWIIKNEITGKVYLVPAPPSVPMECNRSFPIAVLVEMWRKYAFYIKSEIKCEFVDFNAVERYWPTTPAHMTKGRREVEPHLDTLGVYKFVETVTDASAVIIIDDVVTSGTQMSAVASLLIGAGIFADSVPIFGYALARTTRPGFDQSELLRLFSEAEKAGA